MKEVIFMICDITGTVLMPGKRGEDCSGNGTSPDIECCCDECDYLMCCQPDQDPKQCMTCEDKNCPRSGNS